MFAVADHTAILGIGPTAESARVEAMANAQTWLPPTDELLRTNRNTSASLYMAPCSPELAAWIQNNGTPDSWDVNGAGLLVLDA